MDGSQLKDLSDAWIGAFGSFKCWMVPYGADVLRTREMDTRDCMGWPALPFTAVPADNATLQRECR